MKQLLTLALLALGSFGLAQTGYICADGARLSLSLSQESADLTYRGQTYTLTRQPSASGVVYSDSYHTWHGKGEGGFLEVGGVRATADCVVAQAVPPGSRTASLTCDGGATVRAYFQRGRATFVFKEQTYLLPLRSAASSLYYSDGRAEWRGKGNEGSLKSLRTGQVLAANCREVSITAVLTGTATYRARIALPADAVLEVKLLERTPTGAVTLTETQVQSSGAQVPLSFDLTYDAGRVKPDGDYAVTARITSGGRELWATPAPVRVLTAGAGGPLELVLVQSR